MSGEGPFLWLSKSGPPSGFWQLPPGGMCVCAFLFVKKDGKILLGKYADDPKLEELTGLDARRRQVHGKGLTIPLPGDSFGPAELVRELSSSVAEQRPVVRSDGLELFLYSNRPGGFGLNDLWVSTRKTVSDPWTIPVNLGPVVNSPYEDWWGYIAPDRRTLYFGSSRPGGFGGFDLYVTIRIRK